MSRAVPKIVQTNRYMVHFRAFSAYFHISEGIEINAEVFSLISGLNRMGKFARYMRCQKYESCFRVDVMFNDGIFGVF